MTGPAKIDTTPSCPRPPQQYVDEAAKVVPLVLSDVAPDSDGEVVLIASHLVGKLQKSRHTLAAAQWAIHSLIQVEMLRPARIPIELPSYGHPVGRTMHWSGGQRGTIGIPEGKPAPFEKFQVVATPKLWEWWRDSQATSATQVAQPSSDPASVVPLEVSDQPTCDQPPQGVTLFDLAFAIEADDLAAKNMVRKWINNQWLSAPSIGRCPIDGRRRLYRLSELLSDAKKILSLSDDDERKYYQALAARVRQPRCR